MPQIIPFFSLMVFVVICLWMTGFTYTMMREPGDELSIPLSLLLALSTGLVLGIMLHFVFCYIFPNGLQTTLSEITPFWEPIIDWFV